MGLQRTLRARAFIGADHENGFARKRVKRNKNRGKTKRMRNISCVLLKFAVRTVDSVTMLNNNKKKTIRDNCITKKIGD